MSKSEILLVEKERMGKKESYESFTESEDEEKKRVFILNRRKVRWIRAVRGKDE